MNFAMIGPAIVLGLACLGSAVGCGIAGMASHGVMARVDENHGKFIGMSALPSLQRAKYPSCQVGLRCFRGRW